MKWSKKLEELALKAEKLEKIYLKKKELWEDYKLSEDFVEEAEEACRAAWEEYEKEANRR